MWAQMKLKHVATTRTHAEVFVIGVALALIAAMLFTFTTVARDQVRKAEMRDALLHSQSSAMARCWADAPNPVAMRTCTAEVALQRGVAVDQSYDPSARQRPAPSPDVSLVSYKY